ncbi:uncharacterized protein A1O9_01525 [Exophiala aquamarina CBS 119918]|uniref:Carboxylic ester hydrolase n=1 Tax=Exophiala aquamarina CBS 119918 TaxID=1182545 RepID=A0A072PUV7_9EURO|nr:uncharacterized protein A1O9_01525 [Exophiala aquamarina CBS 119918]KEF63547.1 hypothetical protein A1O9_01525 [Exophiala aquamarina CBS 119918]
MSLKEICLLTALTAISPAWAILQCSTSDIQEILPGGATVLRAVSLGPNSTFGDVSEVAYPRNSTGLPALCALTINVTSSPTSSFRFGLYLPQEWNTRFAAVGTGGIDGGINWPAMGPMVKYGFAVASTDTGHNSTNSSATWALSGPETVTDWAYRAVHGSTVLAKQIVSAYYAAPINFSYYNGCSTGGRQGLVEAVRYPEDFDGILVGAPAWQVERTVVWLVQQAAYNLPNTSDHAIPVAKNTLIRDEALRQCDGVDGVVDGVISAPEICAFRPETLLCRGEEAESCLTAPQINTLHLLYGTRYDVDKPVVYHPYVLGSETEWTRFLPPNAPLPMATNAFRDIFLRNATWDWRDLNYTLAEDVLNNRQINATLTTFDLVPFASRGGKLLHWHGLADALVPYTSSQHFYELVYGKVTSEGVEMDGSYRLFLVPGLGHCARSANNAPWYFAGANQPESMGTGVYGVPGFRDAAHDGVLALMQWVENGIPPKSLVVTKFANDTISSGVKSQRKVCPYPSQARLVGQDVHVAQDWTCSVETA